MQQVKIITEYSKFAIECCRSIYAPAKQQIEELERMLKQ